MLNDVEKLTELRDPQSALQFFRDLASRARHHGQAVWTELLEDLEIWSAAPDEFRRQCISAVSDSLWPQFQFLGEETFRSGGQKFEIASFRFRLDPQEGLAPTRNNLDWVFRLVPGGTYRLGSEESEKARFENEGPVRSLSIRPMLVGATPVTQVQWDQIGGVDQRDWSGVDLPIEGSSWSSVKQWLGKLGGEFRLPSEAEWEFFCRANSRTRFFFGDDEMELADYAWFRENSGQRTHPVGGKRSNAFGLHDLLGNVWEWCEDRWIQDYVSGPVSHLARDSDSEFHCCRGASWYNTAEDCRSAIRFKSRSQFSDIGFRMVKSIL